MTYRIHAAVYPCPDVTVALAFAITSGRLGAMSPLCPCRRHTYPGWRMYRPRRKA